MLLLLMGTANFHHNVIAGPDSTSGNPFLQILSNLHMYLVKA